MRRKSRNDSGDELAELFASLVGFYLLALLVSWYLNRATFWHLVNYGIITLIVLIVSIYAFFKIKNSWKQKRSLQVLETINRAGLQKEIENFILRWGNEKKSVSGFMVREYNFSWNRINDFVKDIQNRGIKLSNKDFESYLYKFINEKEENLTHASIQTDTRELKSLSGADFERLLVRLYEKMGYSVQHIGQSGDQGGDLIVNKGSSRILIQAKAYNSWSVGNDSVQQAFTAKQHYDCNHAMVITTGHFTPAAFDIARTTHVELIERKHLQDMLQGHLGESWA